MPSTAVDSDEGVYKEVRGLSRGLAVLKALSRLPGGVGSTSELAHLCGLDRTTKRLLRGDAGLLRRRCNRLDALGRDAALVRCLAAQTLEYGCAINELEWLQVVDFAAGPCRSAVAGRPKTAAPRGLGVRAQPAAAFRAAACSEGRNPVATRLMRSIVVENSSSHTY